MSLRFRLLLLSLATLVLPWAGCNYAREMESALREGEQNSLLSVAQAIASSLQGRVDLLYCEVAAAPRNSEPTETATTDSEPPPRRVPKPTPYDLRPILLPASPYVDGYTDEWPQSKSAWKYF